MDLFTYLMAKKGHNIQRDLFSYLLGKGGGGGILPDGYRQVEYIEGTGTQYIDTGRKSTINTKIEFTFLSNKQVGDAYQNIFGTQYSGTIRRTYMLINSATNTIQTGFNTPNQSAYYLTTNGTLATSNTGDDLIVIEPNTKNHYVYDVPNKTVKFNDYTCTTTDALDLQGSYKSLLFFNRNVQASIPTTNLATGRLYDFKWYENNQLVMNLIPCIRESDNAAGLYDIIENQFYGNAGTGDFVTP